MSAPQRTTRPQPSPGLGYHGPNDTGGWVQVGGNKWAKLGDVPRLLYGVPRVMVPPGWTHIAPPGIKTQPKLPAGYILITNVNTGQTKIIPGKQ